MGNHITAKMKLRNMASKIEKTLYALKYGHEDVNILDSELYFNIQNICTKEKLSFPLVRKGTEFYLNDSDPQLYYILLKLAHDYGIILDDKQILE